MTLTIWCGVQPRQRFVHDLLARLRETLDPLPEPHLALVNFYPSPTTEVDLVVIKPQGIFVAETKHWPGPIVSCDDQNWALMDGTKPTTVHNPFKAVRRKYWEIKEWLRRNGNGICGRPDRAAVMNWRAARSFVVVYPTLHADSILPSDSYTRLLSFDGWLQEIQQRRQPGLDLTTHELAQIPQLLRLETYIPVQAPGVINARVYTPPHSSMTAVQPVQQLVARGHDMGPPTMTAVQRVQQLVARGHDIGPPVFNVAKPVATIGSTTTNDHVLPHPSIADCHAEIRLQADTMILTNLDNLTRTYATLPNQPERRINSSITLHTGAIVRFGELQYTVIAG